MPKKHSNPLEYVNLSLLKATTKKAADALDRDKTPKELEADAKILPGGQLFYLAPPATAVAWRSFLLPGFRSTLPDFRSKHVLAALFFPCNKRIFVATFGYGRALLAEDKLEPDFGLRTALQLCDPDTLKAVDYRTIEERTRIGRVQLSDKASMDAFHMDVDTDLLRGLEARSSDPAICDRLAARWANLTVGARVTVSDLPVLAGKLLAAYKKKALPKKYAWIDNVMRVTDPALNSSLDSELRKRLDGGKHNGIRLALPEILGERGELDARFFQPDGPEFDGQVQVYLAARGRHVEDTLLTAKHAHKVILVNPSGQKRATFSIYRCLVAEIEYKSELYLLADGEWFSLNKSFVNRTNLAVNRIPRLSHKLPAWMPKENEGKWNKRACEHWTDAAYLDKGNIQIGGPYDKVEPADFLTKGLVLAHAKRRDKNSSGLSHMFSQGAVSARLIRQHRKFRTEIADQLPASHASVAAKLRRVSFDPTPWTVAYVVLGADPKKPGQDLPFFSKVNLVKHAEQLKLMDFRVGIIGV